MKKLIELTLCDGCQSCIEETSPGVYRATGDHVLSQEDVTEAMQAKLDTKELMIELMTKQAIDLNQTLQAKLGAQAEELAALRAFVMHLLDYEMLSPATFQMHKLLDENEKPTPLLTGENLEY